MTFPRLDSDRGLGALGGVCAALVLLVLAELIARPSVEPIAPQPPAAPAAKGEAGAPGVPQLPPLAQFSEVVERNLFSETRRGRETEGDAGGAARAIDAQLVGIFISDDSESVALFRVAGSDEFVRVTKGQAVRGRRVAAILPDRVVLQGDEPNEIRLQETEAAGPPPDLGGRPQSGRTRPTPLTPPAAPPPPAGGAVDRGAADRAAERAIIERSRQRR
jgi:hypothetical protein